MDHAVIVRVPDRAARLAREVERLRHVERAAGNHGLQRLALDVFHDDEEDVFLLLGRRDRDDVGMIERRQQPRLVQQLGEVEVLPVGHLERDVLVDPGIPRQVHGARNRRCRGGATIWYLPSVWPWNSMRWRQYRATRPAAYRPGPRVVSEVSPDVLEHHDGGRRRGVPRAACARRAPAARSLPRRPHPPRHPSSRPPVPPQSWRPAAPRGRPPRGGWRAACEPPVRPAGCAAPPRRRKL